MKSKKFSLFRDALIGIITISLISGYAVTIGLAAPAPTKPDEVSLAKKLAAFPGYLQDKDYPDSLALVPAPPTPGSAAFALDEDSQCAIRLVLPRRLPITTCLFRMQPALSPAP